MSNMDDYRCGGVNGSKPENGWTVLKTEPTDSHRAILDLDKEPPQYISSNELEKNLQGWEYLQDYKNFVNSRLSPESLKDPLGTACYGLSGEVGEFVDHNKKILYQGKQLDRDHLIKELGDIMFYVGTACIALEVSLKEVIDMNV